MSQEAEQMTLEDWLDDLSVRFIINLPEDDLSSVARICFQIEEAHWFYEDFIRPLDPNLPNMSLRTFCTRMFQHCPLFASFSEDTHVQAYEEFLQYKNRIPVRGAILLNEQMDSTVLVRSWKKNGNWSFPRGKINKDEDDLDCAIREVYEETGFDVRKAGLVPADNLVKYVEQPMRDQHVRLYVFRGVPEDTIFEAQTRKEIGAISWYALKDLPAYRKKKSARNEAGGSVQDAASNANKFYMVAPFLVKLKNLVIEQRKQDSRKAKKGSNLVPPPLVQEDADMTDDVIQETDEISPPGYRESATKELHRLLNLQPASESQPVQPASKDLTGSALLSILQPAKSATNGHSQQPDHYHIHTPQDHIYTEVPQPHTPHHPHSTQRLPHSFYEQQQQQQPQQQQSPQYRQMVNTSANYQQQQYHQRPQVQMTAGPNGMANFKVSTRQYQSQQSQSIQLQHPQPQHPQVQQSRLMRDMVPTPDQAGPAGSLQASQSQNHLLSPFTSQHQISKLESKPAPSGPSNQQKALLNIFKSPNAQPNTDQHDRVPLAARQPVNNLRPVPPTDKHRSDLLGIFKHGASSSDLTPKQQMAQPEMAPEQPMSTAETIRVAAQENGGRPVVVNPELNLPFGALSIAVRPQSKKSTQQPSQPSPGFAPQSPARVASRDSPAQSATMSTSQPIPQPKNQAARSFASYPYGGSLTQNSALSAMAMNRAAPAASALPVPAQLKPRHENTPEQKNALLSLFGTSKPDQPVAPHQSRPSTKGKEPAISGPGSGMNGIAMGVAAGLARPRSGVASIASGNGDGSPASPSGSSKPPLSPADREFLQRYLQDASKVAIMK